MEPQAFTDQVSQHFRALAERMELLQRRLHPHHGGAAQARLPGAVGGAGAARRDLPRPLRGLVRGARRGLLRPGRADRAGRRASTRPPARRWSGCGSRPTSSGCRSGRTGCCASTRRIPDFIAPQSRRNEVMQLREGRAAGPLDQPHLLRLGRPGAGRPGARDVCLAGRADQLHHRGRLPGRGGGALDVLAGRRAFRRQGHPPLPRDLLAGLPRGRRDRAAAARLRAWLVDDRGAEDVEVPRQRHRPAGADRGVRPRPAALLPAARGALRQRRRLRAHGAGQPAQRRAGGRRWATWRSGR